MNNNYNHPVEIDLSKTGSNLYIFFGGISAGIAMPPFEFYNSSKIIDENKIFIRDFSQSWYQDGLSKISKDIHTTRRYLEDKIGEIKPKHIYFVGNSMGGYGAILFAKLVGKGEAIAFAPQTFISPILRLKYRDFRWQKQVFSAYSKSLLKSKVWDLRPIFLHSQNSQKVSIFVSKGDPLDIIHAYHLNNIAGVNIYEFDCGGHEVVRLLRDEGILPEIMSGRYST